MSLYPIRVYGVELEFSATTSMPFFHQAVLRGFINTLLNIPEQIQNRVLVHAPESGVIQYQKGTRYRFYLISINLPEIHLEQLFTQLTNLPRSAAHCYGALAHNIKLHQIFDPLTQMPVAHPLMTTQYDHHSILLEAEQWQRYSEHHHSVTLSFQSPVRLSHSGKRVYQQSDELHGSLIIDRCFDAYASLCQVLGYTRPARQAPVECDMTADLHWADTSYQSKGKQAKQLGGLVGTLTLNTHQLSYDNWVTLVLGQYIGIGQNRNFGMGRYHLVGEQGELGFIPLPRTTPLLHQVFNLQTLELAWQHEIKKLPKSAQSTWGQQAFERLLSALQNLHYQPGALNPKMLDKPGQKQRLLLLPSFIDKVAHKALSTWLGTSLDLLYSKSSYAYRRGYSRLTARDSIVQAVRAGYEYVLDADIKQFFASLQPSQVIARLRALYGDDPLWAILNAMLHAPIANTQQHDISQVSGLNLGSSLSPVLANLMLDPFDAILGNQEQRLVRYADDFLILCRTKQQAERTLENVKKVIAHQGLELNEEKTQVVHISKGVKFLGYLFINDLVISIKPEKSPTPEKQPPSMPETSNSCYFNDSPMTLCITGRSALLNCQGKRLKITQGDDTQALIPLTHLQTVVLFGNHHITTPALKRLMKQKINVYFADGFGNYIGQTLASSPLNELHLIQASRFANKSTALEFSKTLLSAKIHNQREVLRLRKLMHEPLSKMLNKLKGANSIAQCLGFEGSASKTYYQQLALVLPDQFEFTTRVKQQPRDPVNSLLSYGYSLLYCHVSTLLQSAGLYPNYAGLHQAKGQHHTLASDLMEPFRFVVERTMINALNLNQISVADFEQQGTFCRIREDKRRLWSKLLIEALQTPKYKQGQLHYSLLDAIQQQNYHLIDWLKGESPHFTPWRLPR